MRFHAIFDNSSNKTPCHTLYYTLRLLFCFALKLNVQSPKNYEDNFTRGDYGYMLLNAWSTDKSVCLNCRVAGQKRQVLQ